MTVSEYAKQEGVSSSTVYRRIRKGSVKSRRIGRRWDIFDEVKVLDRSRSRSQPVVLYDPEKHILLKDQAHLRRIYTETEMSEYLQRIASLKGYDLNDPNKQMEVFDVQIPDFPPVPRTPLAFIFSIGGVGDGGPFGDKPWIGRQPAVVRDFWTNRETFAAAKAMVPDVEIPNRVAYMWQCPMFRPKQHIPARRWSKVNDVGIVKFYRSNLWDEHPEYFVKTVNPYLIEEKASGSYSPTCRCIVREYLNRVEDKFLRGRQSVLPEIPVWPGWDYDAVPSIPDPKFGPETVPQEQEQKSEPEKEPEKEPEPEPRETLTIEPEPPAIPDNRYIAEGAVFYNPNEVLQVLRQVIDRKFGLFGGQASDSQIVGIERKALQEFLKRDTTNKHSYILDVGGRNFDCDDFAVMIRAALSKHGLNSAGIIWGDSHAWNLFVVVGSSGPEIVFVEPQSDAIVVELTGEYSIKRRCEIYL